MLKVVITGPESTGKSTLASALSTHFNAVLSEEYAREYLETKLTLQKFGKNIKTTYLYDESDFHSMFLGQKNNEKKAFETAKATRNFIICDTDALTYQIWYEEVFKNSDYPVLNIVDFFNKSRDFEETSSIYLLCSPESIVWQPDPLRENPNDRDRLFHIYLKKLSFYNQSYFILRGGKEQRFAEAVNIISRLLKNE